MSKVLTFSRVFPAYHSRAGQPTHFVEKIYNSFNVSAFGETFIYPTEDLKALNESLFYTTDILNVFEKSLANRVSDVIAPKYHTIRAGNRWKVGDMFSPRVWSGKPYNSRQIIIAPDIQVKKVWDIGLRIRGDFKEFYANDCDLTHTSIANVAANDGLGINDLFDWFNKPFSGQIICWNDKINY